MSEQYQYDAFISYRHCELDQFVAKTIHRELEAFHVSKRMAEKYNYTKNKIQRVFRDKEELPLTDNLGDPIMAALQSSEYLIVICTPRIKESIWCRKEIETFIQLHGREKVLAVLAEGEPSDSYPEELLKREKVVTLPDGTETTIYEDIEPLGADVRGKTEKEVKKAIKEELPRLVAPMFGTSFDGLKQRHREQKIRKILGISTAVSAVFLTFGIISSMMALRIADQNTRIASQNQELLYNQAIRLAEDSERFLENGDRIAAIDAARESLSGEGMPYTEEAEYALSESLRVYETGNTLLPQYQVKTASAIKDIVMSKGGTYFASLDDVRQLSIHLMENGEILKVIQEVGSIYDHNMIFLSDTVLAYLGEDGVLYNYDVESEEIKAVLSDEKYTFLQVDYDRSHLAVGNYKTLEVYDLETLTLLHKLPYEGDDNVTDLGKFFVTEDAAYYVYKISNIADLQNTLTQIGILNLNTGDVFQYELGHHAVKDFDFLNGQIYIISTYYEDLMGDPNSRLDVVNPNTGEVLLTRDYEDVFCTSVMFTTGDNPALLVVGSTSINLVDPESGDLRSDLDMGYTVIGYYGLDESDVVVLFMRDGSRMVLDTTTETAYENLSAFESHSDTLSGAYTGGGGILFTESSKNTVTRYIYYHHDYEAYEGDVEWIETEKITFSEARELAEERGYADPSLVENIFTNTEETLTFVYYKNRRLGIYDSETGELKNLLEDTRLPIDTYYGEDAEGNYYVGNNFYGAYKINENHKITAYIEYLKQVNAQDNTFIIGDDPYVTCPNYSIEALSSMTGF